jgi:hypothetical protein
MDKLARSLPLHLTTVLMFSSRDEVVFRYVSCGIRLLHSFCDLSPRLHKFDQVNRSNPYDLVDIYYIFSLWFFVLVCFYLWKRHVILKLSIIEIPQKFE